MIDFLLRSCAALAPFASWLATFTLHALLSVLLALLVCRIAGRGSLVWRERALRWSLLLPLLSATLQWAVVGSSWALPTPMVDASPVADVVYLAPAANWDVVASRATVRPAPPAPAFELGGALVLLALLSAGAGFGWLGLQWLRLRRVLRSRNAELDPRVLGAAAAMAHRGGMQSSPRISRSLHLTTPIAFGLLRQEVCLPARAGELDDGMLKAMLAHELAHLRRADAAWMWGVAAVQAAFPWLLPLSWARRAWTRVVELRCDAVAAEHSSNTDVARCLLEVADWLRPGRNAPLAAFAMAARPSALRERIEAMLAGPRRVRTDRWAGFAFAFGSLTSLTMAAPGWPLPQGESLTTPVEPSAVMVEEEVGDGGDERSLASALADAERDLDTAQLLEAVHLLEREHAELTAQADELRSLLAGQRDEASNKLSALLEQRLATLALRRARLSGLARQSLSSSVDPVGEER